MTQSLSALTYFETLVSEADRIPLLEAAASLAQDEYPELDLQQVLSDVDVLALRLSEQCRQESTEISRLQVAIEFFYRELGFSGNVNDYYSPENSYIHKVLETRRGIPVSLAVVFVELARHVGLDAHGVSFPGHFLVGINLHDGSVVLDPFTGTSLSNEALHERLDAFRAPLRLAPEGELPIRKFVVPASPREILLRMLRNLHEIYSHHHRSGPLQRVRERIAVLERQVRIAQSGQSSS